ncbi:MAG: MFS transporter [Bacteroidetes bacterium]|nr:MFS transporter [Bacteroidota bacterium]MBL6944409.1 MFS transporter [Bacteroidales bacterium]
MQTQFKKDLQYYKFCFYGFFKNLRFFDAFLMLFFLGKGINFLEIGILYSAREITILIMEIPSGVISDALGRRKTLIISFFAYILSFIVFYFSQNYITLLAAMILFALADAFRTGVHKAMIFQYLKINNWSIYKIDYYGHTRSWSQTGSAISSLLAAIFVFYTERYDIIFIASIVPYMADMLLIYSYPKYLDGEIVRISGEKVVQRFRLVIMAFSQTIKNMNFFRVMTNLSLYTGYYKAVKDYIQPLLVLVALSMPFFAYLNNEKRIAITIGVIYFIIYLLTAVFSRYSGKFTNLFKHLSKPMNLTLTIGLSVGVLTGLSFHLGYYVWPIVGFIVIMMIENLRKPVGIGLVANISKDESMATTLSVTSQATSVLAAIIAPIIGWIADIYNPGIGIAIISIILIIGLPIYWLKQKNI